MASGLTWPAACAEVGASEGTWDTHYSQLTHTTPRRGVVCVSTE
jgi:hypothetical protein